MDLSRKFAELVGLCWHETERRYVAGDIKAVCKKCGTYGIDIFFGNLDYVADPRLVLREMVKREDFPLFMARLMYMGDSVEGIDWDNNIDVDLILDEEGMLVKAAISFLENKT